MKKITEKWLESPILQKSFDPLVVIAMSGGVDSSVSALKIKEAGFRCEALFIKSWDDDSIGGCHWEDDVADALDVCDRLSIPINTVDLTEDYWELVFQEFLSEISEGKTPNPDILCNKEIKFNTFKVKAQEIGADVIATGHYAQLRNTTNGTELWKSSDKSKDQTYFLHSLSQAQLKNIVFPIGESQKSEIRKLANSSGLKNYSKKDSTGICFVGKRKFRPFLSKFVTADNGPIVDTQNRKIGEHEGVIFYTIGQRKGLGIGGIPESNHEPWYVVDKILPENKLVVGQGNHPALYSKSLIASKASWISATPKTFPFHCQAKIRYGQTDQICKVEETDEKKLKIVFKKSQRAITPGQSIVFYSGDTCLGGALIESKTT